jgi:hypothetical protein
MATEYISTRQLGGSNRISAHYKNMNSPAHFVPFSTSCNRIFVQNVQSCGARGLPLRRQRVTLEQAWWKSANQPHRATS